MSAAASPPGPAPMMPTLSARSSRGLGGVIQPSSQAVSVMYFSIDPMVTVPWARLFDHAIAFAQPVLRQMRPQISGKVLVAWLIS